METGSKVAREVAEAEFERWAEAMGLDLHADDAEDIKARDDNKRIIVGAIERGSLVINDAGEAEFTPTIGDFEPITFKEPDGAVLLAADGPKAGQNVHKQNAVLAAMTGTNAKLFAKLKNRDYKICQALVVFLLA